MSAATRGREAAPARVRQFAAVALTLLSMLGVPFRALPAQVDPGARWLTISTEHFRVHFTRELEEFARRAAANAERAYAQLAAELHPPRGPIDLVVSDDVDFSNGSATSYPTNRIVIYANPPVSESALRFTDDWNALVVTHELTHVFHLDRARGVWGVGQRIFGRASVLFPNFNSPAWLTEGLAVYYESRFTGAGRLLGSEHRALARAAAIDHRFPALNTLSLANPNFPFGQSAYAFGSLAVASLAESQPGKVGTFVEKASAQLIPYFPNVPARQAFGKSFVDAWREFETRVTLDAARTPAAPIVGWRDLTRDDVVASNPRWWSDSALVYSGTSGKETHGAYRVTPDGEKVRIGRRNSRTPNVLLPDGSVLFAQLDFVSPYQERSDLFIQRDRGAGLLSRLGLRSRYTEERLTRGARLFAPDARRTDGAIVAAQIVAGGTRLVRVTRDGGAITPLTGGSADTQWTEPRWSNAGDRIAAVRWRRGGVSEIVVLDSTGRELLVIASGHSIQATPSWRADDGALLYSSDRTGRAEIYLHALSGRPEERRLTTAATGLFEPQLSRDTLLAAVILRGSGYRVGMAPCCRAADTAGVMPVVASGAAALPRADRDTSPVSRYSPWRTLWPRYWLPASSEGMFPDKYRLGVTTSGSDVIGRHSYDAELLVPVDNSGIVGSFSYRYAGLGLPFLDLSARQDWLWIGDVVSGNDPTQVIGEIRRRTRDADLVATWVRQRVRSAFSVSAGAGLEHRTYAVLPDELRPNLQNPTQFDPATVPRVLLGAAYARTQRPAFSISPEDGFTVAVTARERLKSGVTSSGPPSLSVVGTATAYKSLDLFGFAHHVIALRGAGGWADLRSNGYFDVGGTSGTPIELALGYTVGEGRRTFGVRGFPGASFVGVRALGGTAAYRLPLAMFGRGIATLPVYFAQSSLELFADAASAWCPSAAAGRQVCRDQSLTDAITRTIASVGGELNLTTAVFDWDNPYRLRFGVAVPVRNPVGARPASVYFAAGLGF